VIASVDGLVRTMARLYADRHLTILAHVPSDHIVRVQREDLDEMLGNLLDNASKWSASQIVVTSTCEHGRIAITVDDDGPGLAPSLRTAVLERGVRADEVAPGSGFGLAIVHDLAEVYGGSIALDAAPGGGLRARLELPAAGA
jgi:signal transduction histidine kinase